MYKTMLGTETKKNDAQYLRLIYITHICLANTSSEQKTIVGMASLSVFH
jgi:hypothetical protein